ncbi:hypothetical protein M9H77_01126 [Catharanthus roseus]|uniref:Uncharacterized protein n=1 Tax=Catharanthus roseus TaxID=4058 RepID=A0ACC0C4S7_CATRO|nr:hypothetical protein M9H77_01126 [Catharanthus roseus]
MREKASFRRLVPTNRCLVEVEGFYEWKKDGSKRQPYYIHFQDERPMVFAALFDSWKNSEGEALYTFTILTTSSSSSLAWLHDRMPVIFSNKESIEMWLNAPPSTNFDTILKPYEEKDLAWYPVTPAMGKPSFDGPECIKEIQLKTNENRTISEFFSKKGAGRQPGSKPYSRNTTEEATEIHPPKTEEDTANEDPKDSQAITDKDNDDNKPDNFESFHQGAANISMKREYEELSTKMKHSDEEADKHVSPPQKRLKDESGETEMKHKEETKTPSLDETDKLGKGSAKKKTAASSNKQPTLLSYFGKG